MGYKSKLIMIAGLVFGSLQPAQAALPERDFCVFDPLGDKGPLFQNMVDYRNNALDWGIQLNLIPHTNEAVALADFQAGKCDGAFLTGTRMRPFNKFTASIEAIGGLNDYDQTKKLIGMLSSPKASKFMIDGQYEIAGILPGGSVNVYVRDRAIDSVEAAAGKRIGTIDYDLPSITLVKQVGATMVPVSVATFAPRFNNGDVDIAYAPAIAFEPLEMYKGLGDKGGIYRFGLSQMNGQMVVKKDRFPDGFAQSSREYAYKNFDKAIGYIIQAEANIPEKFWVDLPDEKKKEYKEMLREVRITLAEEGVYDKRMMKIMLRLRCAADPSHHECVERREG